MASTVIDLRSDTVTQPCDAMRSAMVQAEVGDDVYGEDPTVNRLEEVVADMLGKEAAVFCATGTQSNLVGMLAHCGRGDEYIVGANAHTYLYEGGGAAVLGSIQPQTLTLQDDATMDLAAVEAAIKPSDVHYARTRLVCLENTHDGICLPMGYTSSIREICDRHGLVMHLDGARVFNASIAQGMPVATLAEDFDSVSVCLSKGLGTPVGSLLAGSAELVTEARHWRKMLGGGMRQAGIIAAAGLHALAHNIDRLADDHAHAAQLAEVFKEIPGVTLRDRSVVTNMVHVSVGAEFRQALETLADEQGIKLPGGQDMRLVTHLDIDEAAVGRIAELFRGASSKSLPGSIHGRVPGV